MMSSLFRSLLLLPILGASGQTPIYSWSGESLVGWSDVAGTITTGAGYCDATATVGGQCAKLQGVAEMSTVVPTTGYHTIQIEYFLQWIGGGNPGCYVAYSGGATATKQTVSPSVDATFITISVHDTDDYNDQASFAVYLGNSAASKDCWFDDLTIFGTEYTPPPTGNPTTPSSYPTTNPSASSTQDTTNPTAVPSSSATATPSNPPTLQPTGYPTAPSSNPSADPSASPTANPSNPTTAPSSSPIETASPSGSPTSRRPTGDPTSDPSILRTTTAQPSESPIPSTSNDKNDDGQHVDENDNEDENKNENENNQLATSDESGSFPTAVVVALIGGILCLVCIGIAISCKIQSKRDEAQRNKLEEIQTAGNSTSTQTYGGDLVATSPSTQQRQAAAGSLSIEMVESRFLSHQREAAAASLSMAESRFLSHDGKRTMNMSTFSSDGDDLAIDDDDVRLDDVHMTAGGDMNEMDMHEAPDQVEMAESNGPKTTAGGSMANVGENDAGEGHQGLEGTTEIVYSDGSVHETAGMQADEFVVIANEEETPM